MLKHQETCMGLLDTLQCVFCKEKFNSKAGKCRHMQRCPARLAIEEEASTAAIATAEAIASTIHIQNIENQTINIANQTNIENQTNNNINIIVYGPQIPFLTDHLTAKQLKKMTNHQDFKDTLIDFSKAVLDRPENKCIRKESTRYAQTAVHLGNDVWQNRSDRQVYTQLTSLLADEFITKYHDTPAACVPPNRRVRFEELVDNVINSGEVRGRTTKEDRRNARLDFNILYKGLKGYVIDMMPPAKPGPKIK